MNPQQPRITAAQVRAKYPGEYDDLTDAQLEEAANKKASVDEGFLASIWAQLKDVPANLYTVGITPPWETVKAIAGNTYNAGREAVSQFAQGNMDEANRNVVRAIPFLGEPAVKAADQAAAGNYGGAAGTMVGVGALTLGPEAARFAPKYFPGKGILRSGNTALAEAVDFGLARDVPMNLGVASGQKWLQRADLLTDATTIPGFYRNGEWQSAEGLRRVGADLANDVRPGGKVLPREAGEQLHSKAMAEAEFYAKKASKAAQDLEALAATKQQSVIVQRMVKGKLTDVSVTMAAPVDVGAAKAALKPVYDEWLKTSTPALRDVSAEFSAIKSIVKGDDFVPLSVALKNQSAIGKMTEASGPANFKNVGEGLASKAYGVFHKAVKETVDNIGGTSLYEDRQRFTKAKLRRAEAVERTFPIKGKDVETGKVFVEPEGGYLKLVRDKDKNVAELIQMRATLPANQRVAEMSNMGRAWVEELLTKAESTGGFSHHRALKNSWDNLGDRTKAILFPDATVRGNLNKFFELQDAIGQQVNTSGTGGVNAMMQVGKAIGKAASPNAAAYGVGAAAGSGAAGVGAAQLVGSLYNIGSYSPKVVRALVQGTIPLRTPLRVGAELGRASLAAPDLLRPTKENAERLTEEKVVTRAQLEAVAAGRGTTVEIESERAKAEGYVIRD